MQNYNYYPPAYDYVTPNTGYAQQPSQYAMDPSYYAGYGMQGPVREVNAGYPQYQTGPWYNEAPQYTPTYAQQLGPQVAASYPPRVDRRRSSSLRGWQGWHYGPPPGTTAQGPFPQITLEEYRRSMPAYYSPTGQRVAGDPEELGSPGAVPGTPMTLEPEDEGATQAIKALAIVLGTLCFGMLTITIALVMAKLTFVSTSTVGRTLAPSTINKTTTSVAAVSTKHRNLIELNLRHLTTTEDEGTSPLDVTSYDDFSTGEPS